MGLWPDTFVREVADRRVVFFIGAGLSKTAYPALPTWGKLLSELANLLPKKTERELVGRLCRRGLLLDAAQVIRESASGPDIAARLRDTFQVRPTPRHDLYKDLLFMDPKVVVTTNYDEFLEKNFEFYSGGSEAHSITRHNSEHLLNDLRSPMRAIVKIHGCITNPADVVLDRSSYFSARRDNPGLFQAVSALMTVNTVLFLGYSVNDPDIQLILENINMNMKGDNPHYALVSKFEHAAMRRAFKCTYNIEAIEYPAGDYDSVPRLISELQSNVEALRSSRMIV